MKIATDAMRLESAAPSFAGISVYSVVVRREGFPNAMVLGIICKTPEAWIRAYPN